MPDLLTEIREFTNAFMDAECDQIVTEEIMDEFGISKDDDGRYWCECRSCGQKYELDIDDSDLLNIDDRTPLVCGGSERCIP